MRELHVRRLGLVEYEDGLSAQRLLVEARAPWLGARRRLAGSERCDLRHRLGAHAWRSLGFNSA